MEYCQGGDLANIIKRCKIEKKFIPESVIWSFLSQLILALHECHHNQKTAILHRDIKPENVFLDADQNVKLGDFGLSKICDNPDALFNQTFVGTPYYMSPELINESSYNAKSDIWSLGCLIYELCTLEPPFQSKTQAGLSQKIRAGKLASLPSLYSSDLARIIRAMLTTSHEQRPTTADLMKMGRVRTILMERDLGERLAALDIRTSELDTRERKLAAREAAMKKREEEVALALTMVASSSRRNPLVVLNE